MITCTLNNQKYSISLLENAAHIGLPVPEKLKDVLAQLHNREEVKEEENHE